MSTDIYLTSYSKNSVKHSVYKKWKAGEWVDHFEDVYGECEDSNTLMWVESWRCCMDAFAVISPKDEHGTNHGEMEFPISAEIIKQFVANVYSLDYKNIPPSDYLINSLNKLLGIAETFDFEHNFLCMRTD